MLSILNCTRYPDGGRFSSWFQNENTRLEGKVVTIKKAQDPTDIIWENSGFPVVARFFRVLFTTFVTLGLLAVSYVMIFEARYLTTLYVPLQYPIHCEAYKPLVDYSLDRLGPNFSLNRPQNTSSNTILYQDVLLDYNADYYNQTLYGAQGYLRCYCQQINFDKGLQYMQHGYFFYDAKTRTSQTWCSSLQDNSVEGTAVSYLAAFIIVGINLMLSLLLRRLVNFEKWNSYTNQIISLSGIMIASLKYTVYTIIIDVCAQCTIVKLFFAQYINTGLLSLIIYGDLTRTGGSGINFGAGTEFRFGIFTGDSQDFDVIWCENVCFMYRDV